MPAVQTKMTVNKPGDRYEQEADRMADKVMRMPNTAKREEQVQRQTKPNERLQRTTQPTEQLQKAEANEQRLQKAEAMGAMAAGAEKLQRMEKPKDEVQRKGEIHSSVNSSTQSAINAKTGGGQALSSDVRSFMEPRFGADFSQVRVHTDAESASLNNRLSARAFTYRNHIFFSQNQYQPGTSDGKQLLAHELTHTIQQGHAVQRSPQVSTTTTPPTVQRLGVQDALDYFADKAYFIPGFRLLTILMGFNPINQRSVPRSAANILRGLIELIPGIGPLISRALDHHGVFNKAGQWVEQQLGLLGDIGSDIVSALDRFLDSLSWSDIFDLSGVWERAKRIFSEPITRIIDFALGIASGIMTLIKEVVLRPLAKLAEGTAGYDLLKAVLGRDPITGDPVPRTAETLIGGFMKLIGQEEVWENIKKGKAVARAWAWFQGALAGLWSFVQAIPATIIDTISSLTWQDVITITGIFTKVGRAFLNIAGRFTSWAFEQVLSLLEIIFMVVAPAAMPYLKKAAGAFNSILRNPIAFIGNLVQAGKLGFQMFASRIGTHLKNALINWLLGPLAEAGVYLPQSFSLTEILKLVLSVLGLSWQSLRAKLVKIIPEPVLSALEKTAGILVTLIKEGPVAAWAQIKAELEELKSSLIAQVTRLVTTEIVKAAVKKLGSLLTPAGAVIQAIIAIYNTITFFVERLRQIAAVVGSFINSIAAIAAGQVANAAKKVEQTMARTLNVVLAFMAKFAGLGNIPKKLVGIVQKIRKPVDKAMDKIVAWLGGLLKKLGHSIAQAGLPKDPNERLKLAAQAAIAAAKRLSGKVTKPLLDTALLVIKTRYGLKRIEPYEQGGQWWVKMEINPVVNTPLGVSSSAPAAGGSVTQLPEKSWIRIIASNTFERVSKPKAAVRRGPDGKPQATRFMTDKTDGSIGSHAYADRGVEWEESSFTHPSKYVMPNTSGAGFVLKPEYRGAGAIRPTFYKDTQSSRDRATKGRLPGLQHPTDRKSFLSEGSASDEAGQGYTLTFNGRAVVPKSVASPDHDPPIAEHWSNLQGNNTDQTSREAWNSSLSTYKIMSLKLNLHLGSRGQTYTPDVGINFRGPSE